MHPFISSQICGYYFPVFKKGNASAIYFLTLYNKKRNIIVPITKAISSYFQHDLSCERCRQFHIIYASKKPFLLIYLTKILLKKKQMNTYYLFNQYIFLNMISIRAHEHHPVEYQPACSPHSSISKMPVRNTL